MFFNKFFGKVNKDLNKINKEYEDLSQKNSLKNKEINESIQKKQKEFYKKKQNNNINIIRSK